MSNYADRLTAAIRARQTPAIVGIDPVLERLPPALKPSSTRLTAAVAAIEQFCCQVVDAVAPLVPAVKINSGFFEAFYGEGVSAYYRLVGYAHERGLLVIGDVKRGDIGPTARLYARGHLDWSPYGDFPSRLLPDAVTLAGYLGKNAVRPFIDVARRHGKGIYVLVRPSEPKADEVHEFGTDERFYQHMARLVHRWGDEPELIGENGLSCVGAVVAAKDAESTAALRASLPQTPFLVPGYGAQGGTAEDGRPCFRPDGTGAVITASRSVIYAYKNEKYTRKHGTDWQACVTAACRKFAADVAPLASPA